MTAHFGACRNSSTNVGGCSEIGHADPALARFTGMQEGQRTTGESLLPAQLP